MSGLFIFYLATFFLLSISNMRLLTFLFAVAISPVLMAQVPATAPNNRLDGLLQQAQQLQLAQDPSWLRLLHFERRGNSEPARYRSQVDDPKFFLAKDGNTDAQTELDATLRGLFSPSPSGDAHTQCRFVARLAWLQEKLAFSQQELPVESCSEFHQWHDLLRAERVTLVFPAYYLNSPSSMFGHTLLRLDPGGENWTEMLSFAVNFGADVRADDNSMFYAFKGLTGGYPGTFNVEHYYKKIQTYNRDENRDIWEFPLNLTAAETQRMVLHLWELKEVLFDYFFFDENCSYRVLELLEIARPGLELTDRFGLSAIPIDTVRAALEAGLSNSRQYRPSKVAELKQRLHYIPEYLQPRVIELSRDPAGIQQEWFQALQPPMQARLIEAAYKYLRYKQTGEERDSKVAANSYSLLAGLKKQADVLPKEALIEPGPPDLAHGSRRLSAEAVSQDGHQALNFGLRLSLHSLEERAYGFLQGAQINIGNFEARIEDDADIRLQRFDLIDIFSLSASDEFFQPLSWKVITGIEREAIAGRERQTVHVTGGAGYSRSFWPQSQVWALGMGRLEYNSVFNHPVEPALGINSGLLWHFPQHTARIELSGEKFANGELRRRALYRHNFVIAAQQAISFSFERRWYEHHNSSRFGLRYQYYYSP